MAKKITNKHRVRKSVWERWSEQARGVFNEMMARTGGNNQKFYLHPKVKPVADAYWTTTCWNMAWEAAEIVNGDSFPVEIVTVAPTASKKKRGK